MKSVENKTAFVLKKWNPAKEDCWEKTKLWTNIRNEFIDVFEKENQEFDRHEFLKACQIKIK